MRTPLNELWQEFVKDHLPKLDEGGIPAKILKGMYIWGAVNMLNRVMEAQPRETSSNQLVAYCQAVSAEMGDAEYQDLMIFLDKITGK